MFEGDGKRPRPAYIAAAAIFERREPLRRGRPGPARHSDEEPARQVIDEAREEGE